MRLDKLLCELNIGSRQEVKALIKKGLIKVDDQIIKNPETKVDETVVSIYYLDKTYKYEKYKYFILNKPAGMVSATKDNFDKTVIDLFNELTLNQYKDGYFPVGRLDKDTVGLLLITNDGDLSHKLLSPKYHVKKTYYVELIKSLSEEDVNTILEGIKFKDFTANVENIEIIDKNKCNITICEGKYHEVKRIFNAVDNEVIYLKRVKFGPLILDSGLKEGNIRELTDKEKELLFNV